MAWFPNSIRVLYADGPQLFAAYANGARLELLVDAAPDIRLGSSRYVAGHITHAMASPDGSRVVYAICRYYEPDRLEDPQILRCTRPWLFSTPPGRCSYPITADRAYAFYDIPAHIGDRLYEIAVRHVPTETTRRLFAGDAPVWSPDGGRVAFYVAGDRAYPGSLGAYPGKSAIPREGADAFALKRGLYTMAADGSDVRRIQAWNWTGREDDYPNVDVPPVWSPDGQRVAVVRHAGDEQVIHIVDLARALQWRLAITVSAPAWSPDGARLAFAKPDGDEVALYTIAADGSDARRVTTISGWQPRYGAPEPTQAWIETVGWSPTGDRLLYTCGTSACVVAREGTPEETLSVQLEGGSVAAWSPDGADIAVASAGRPESDRPPSIVQGGVLYRVAADGSDVRLLARRQADGAIVPAEAASAPAGSTPPRDVSECASGRIVPRPSENPGLVNDCRVLLEVRDTLAGDERLYWNRFSPISEWEGIVVGGTPPRVIELHLTPYAITRYVGRQLRGVELSGVIPPGLSRLTALRVLEIGNDQFSDVKVSGVIPPELGRLAHLRVLSIGPSNISGVIPPEFGNLQELRELRLGFNKLSGGIPAELGRLSQLRILYLYSDTLSGELPAELGNLTQLREFHLFNVNRSGISGGIPPEFSNLKELQLLYVEASNLGGEIPPTLGNLTNLKALTIYKSNLTGSIPASLGGLTNIAGMDLSENKLTGHIPGALVHLPNLKFLNLSHNQLSGRIPGALARLSEGAQMAVVGNALTGCVPQGVRLAYREHVELPDCEPAE